MSIKANYWLEPGDRVELDYYSISDGPLHQLRVYPEGGYMFDLTVTSRDLRTFVALRDALNDYIEGRMNGRQLSETVEQADESDLEIVLAEGRMAKWPA